MPIIQAEIIIYGNRQSLFNLTQDYTKRLTWDPFLREASLIGGIDKIRIGARAWCVSKAGIGMETEYVFIQEHVAAIKMTRGPFVLKRFAGSWRYIEIDKSVTKLMFRYYYSTTYKFIEPFLHFWLKHEMKKRLHVLKRKYERKEI